MTTTETVPSGEPKEPVKRKSKLWLKIVGGVVIGVVGLVVLTPTLLSTGPGKNFIVGKVNAGIPGKVTIESLSLGWFSGARVQGFQLTDPNGKTVATAKDLTTGVTVLDALSPSSLSLGHVKLTGVKAEIETYEDGTNNVTRSLMKPAEAEKAAETKPTVEKSNQTISGVIDLTVDELTIRTPTMTLDKTQVTAKVGFDADMGRGVVKITDDSMVEQIDPLTKRGTGLKVAKGSVISWMTEPINLAADLNYDLGKFGAVVTPLLGKSGVGLKTEGMHTMKLHVHGPLTNTAGVGKWSKVVIDPTSIAWDKIEYSGFSFGKTNLPLSMKDGIITLERTQIPANNGSLIVQGVLDFNQDPPAFILTKSSAPYSVVNAFSLNSEVAGGWLSFLPMTWGASGKELNLLNISGSANMEIAEAYIPLSYDAIKSKGTLVGTINIEKLRTDAPIFRQLTGVLKAIPGFAQFEKVTTMEGDIRNIHLAMKDGKISYENFRLGSQWGNVTFSGKVGLDQSLAMDVTVGTTGVNLPIPLSLAGTTSKPKLELSKNFAESMTKDLGGTLKNMEKGVQDMGKGLERLFKEEKNKNK